jgi:hypothetical protein
LVLFLLLLPTGLPSAQENVTALKNKKPKKAMGRSKKLLMAFLFFRPGAMESPGFGKE